MKTKTNSPTKGGVKVISGDQRTSPATSRKVPTRYLRLIDWAQAIGVPLGTVRKWVQYRRIPVIKISGGLWVDPAQAEEAIKRFTIREIS